MCGKAVQGVLERGWSLGAMSANEVTFAEAVVARFPSIEQVRFTNSGTEAALMAVMTARYSTGRDRVVVFDGGYHGGLLHFGPSGAALRAPFDYAVLTYNDTAALEEEFATNGDRIVAAVAAFCERHRSRTDRPDRKSTRLNSSHVAISYAVFCLK